MIAMLAAKGTLSASELRQPFDVAQPTISKHIGTLEAAGLVTRQIEGRVHRFSLKAETLRSAENWIGDHRAFWEGTLDRLEAFVTREEGFE